MERLKNIGLIPINKDILFSLYGELKRPDEKVSELERKGLIIRGKRNLYVVAPKVHNQEISRELVANHLYGPSYVSLESALAYYGLIPERVFTMRSVTTKLHKQYDTPLGHFEYVKVPAPYYPIGVRQEIINNSYAFLIASSEKALCDKIVTTPNLRIQSVKAMREYLEEDLRIDFSVVQNINLEIIRQCIEAGRKKGELGFLLEFLARR
jgi:predicted transcriptional regulator of viral defense system